jgi:uncharacterized membrane protein
MNDALAMNFLAIAAMGVATFIMRAGGFWVMGKVPITARVRRMLEALPGSIVVAIVLPIVVRTGLPGILAVAAAAGTMLTLRKELVAVGVGMLVAALSRLAGM